MVKLFNNEELLKISNNTTFLKYYNQFILLALNMFQWGNLPEGIETRHIEIPLIKNGYAFFYLLIVYLQRMEHLNCLF